MSHWSAAGSGIWVWEYAFGSTRINTAAIDMGDGGLMVISPGTGCTESVYAELDAIGPVRALVAPGAFHHMGLPPWSARYPEAGLYGPSGAIEHIAKQHPTLEPVQSLDALRPLLSDEFELGDVGGCRYPDLFLAVKRDDATTWVTNEIVSNNLTYPSGVVGLVFRITGNAPGLNVSNLTPLLLRGKKPEIRAFYEGRIRENPPTRLLPMHGAVLNDPELGPKLGEVLARRY